MTGFIAAVGVLVALLAGTYILALIESVIVKRRRFAVAAVSPLVEVIATARQELVEPDGADRLLFRSAPYVAIAAVALSALLVPVTSARPLFDPPIGLFWFVVLLAPVVIALMNAGWASNSKVGLAGAFRAAAHLIAYEVPIGFAVIGPVMAAGSLRVTAIIEAQERLWFVAWQPLGLAIYLISALIGSYRHPFDLPMAGSELGGGVFAELSGTRLLLLEFARRALFLLLMIAGVVLFFGGGGGPLLPPFAWLVLKTIVLAAIVLWSASRFPRLRHDQMLTLAWKVLLPASLVNIVAVGILALLIDGGFR